MANTYLKDHAVVESQEKGMESVAPSSDSSSSGGGGDDDNTAAEAAVAVAEAGSPSPSAPLPPPPPPPNGGYGWVCTACVALINGHTWGMNSTYGVFLAHYLANDVFPGATPLQYAFVGSLSISCALMVSPLATVAVRELGTKPPMFLGTALVTASFISASFATRIWHLFLSQGVAFGVGMGLLFIPSVGIIPQWFTTRRSLANSIGAGGSGLGGIVYSVAAGALIQRAGLAWAFRVLGVVAFAVNCVCTALLRDRNKIIGASQLAFDAGILRRPEYLLLVAFGWFSMLSYFVLNFSLASYADAIGLEPSQASLISAFFNVGQCLFRPVIGYFSDRTGRINMAACATLLAGILTLAIWINAKSYAVLIFFAIIVGGVAGVFWTVIAPVTAEVVGLRNVPSALSIMWIMIVLPCLFGEPIALQIISRTGGYLGTQLWTGVIYLASAACLLVLRGWKIAELAEVARARHDAPERADLYKDGEDEELSRQSKQAGRKRMLVNCWARGKV